jgi:hypothetical protein
MTDLTALIARLEAATEGDETLDHDVARAVGWREQIDKVDGARYWTNPSGIWSFPPRFTRSVDAAMSLVPEGWGIEDAFKSAGDGSCSWNLYGEDRFERAHHNSSFSLALVIAALKSRAA